jgi:hypothetical protein
MPISTRFELGIGFKITTMKTIYYLAFAMSLLLFSCNSEPTLQKYFVENQEKPGFLALDISPSILNLEKNKLTPEQSKALASFNKMNILAFKLDAKNKGQFDIERKKVSTILKDTLNYQQLMKFGSGKDGASISYIGDEDHIDEFILYGIKSDNGFAVVRILGNDMNPADAMTFLSILKESNIDMKQLEALKGLMK